MRGWLRSYRVVTPKGRRQESTTALAPQHHQHLHELRETPIEPDPNPKRRLFMESAPSGSQRQWTITGAAATSKSVDDGKRGALPSVMEANTRPRVAEKASLAETQPSSSAVGVTTEEGIDG